MPGIEHGNSCQPGVRHDMPDCQGMQPEQKAAGLCAAHCEKAPQSADTPSIPAVAPFIQGALTVVLSQGDSVLPWTPPPAGFQSRRTGAPAAYHSATAAS
ncbi:hypothetical protein LP420_38280 [Massilia sp. B-10]|nr:hypothetical protein LP420_38280 [Massilia sp. B-10]